MRSEHPATPVFVAASSWAAKLGVVDAARRPGSLGGLLLLGPGLFPTVNLTPGRRVLVVAGHLVGPMARLPIPLTPELYTANPPYREFVRADPLRLLEATTGFFWQTARLDRHRRSPGLPVLLLQGEGDEMMDVLATRRWFERLDVQDAAYRAYPGAGHTLDFEPDRARYLGDLLEWLEVRAASASPGSAGGDH